MNYLRPTLFFSINKEIKDFTYEIIKTESEKPNIENQDKNLKIFINPKTQNYQYIDSEDFFCFVVGYPIINDKINLELTCNEIIKNKDSIDEFSKKLNGAFLILIIDKKDLSFKFINDRFNGIHFYWANLKNFFYGSFLYFDLFKKLRSEKKFELNQDSLLQYLWMSRVMDDATHDNFSKYLMPASILFINGDDIKIEKYFLPNFAKTKRTRKEAGEEYIRLLSQSIKRQTSDIEKKKYCYFFSSGLDSRTVSSAINNNGNESTAMTVAFSDNLEVKYAKEAALCAGSQHKFLKLDKDHLEKNFLPNVEICGGLYATHDALFTGLHSKVKNIGNVIFHGHALDFWHFGNYLPTKFLRIFNNKTHIRKILELKNLEEDYLLMNPLRLTWHGKGMEFNKLFKKEYFNQAKELILSGIRKEIERGKIICKNNYDYWEHFLICAFGRHFTNINITSKITNGIVRTPAYDNDIFNFYLSIPNNQRITDEIRIYALNNIKNSKLGQIPTANHGFPAGYSHIKKTIFQIFRKIKRLMTGNIAHSQPALKDRTWPNLDDYLRSSKFYLNELDEALKNEELKKTLALIDWEYIENKINRWKKGEDFDAIFIICLVSLSKFLQITK